MGQPRENTTCHCLVPCTLGFVVAPALNASDRVMAADGFLKLFEACGRFRVSRNELFLLGGERLVARKLFVQRFPAH